MSASVRSLEHAAQVQFVRAEKAEQQAEDTHHALNLLLNSGFERFHTTMTADGAVHYFELGTVRDLRASGRPDLPAGYKGTGTRRIVLWRTKFPQGHFYASAFMSPNSGGCQGTWNWKANSVPSWSKRSRGFLSQSRSSLQAVQFRFNDAVLYFC